MSTLEEVNLELDKFSLREGLVPKESCKGRLQPPKTRSTPTSPNCWRGSVAGGGHRRESPVIRLALFPCVSEPDVVWAGKEKQKPAKGGGADPACPGSKSEGHISELTEEPEPAEEQTQEEADRADAIIEDATEKQGDSMLSGEPAVIGLRHEGGAPPCPGEALIMPRKLQNPCHDSRDHQNLHRELLFNQKIGKNVLNQKSELQRALEKHKESQIRKEVELQKQDTRTPFEKVIEERARRLESELDNKMPDISKLVAGILLHDQFDGSKLEKSNIEEEPSNKPEFLQVHAKLRARMDSK